MQASNDANSPKPVKMLSEDISRKKLLSIIPRLLSIEKMSVESHIPTKTYRKARLLETEGMITKEETILAEGRKLTRNRSTFNSMTTYFDSGKPTLQVRTREEMLSIWSAFRTSITTSYYFPLYQQEASECFKSSFFRSSFGSGRRQMD